MNFSLGHPRIAKKQIKPEKLNYKLLGRLVWLKIKNSKKGFLEFIGFVSITIALLKYGDQVNNFVTKQLPAPPTPMGGTGI